MLFTIRDLRQELGLSLEAFAQRVGLQSKSTVFDMERDNRCSLNVALAIEKLSNGRIDAAVLNADVAAARASITQANSETTAEVRA